MLLSSKQLQKLATEYHVSACKFVVAHCPVYFNYSHVYSQLEAKKRLQIRLPKGEVTRLLKN